jgi:flavin reductase (DIM6/NTAB) family NADH-FMN oxidoreductase RutF
MKKIKLGAKTFLYPMPTLLLGARVNGKPNFATIAYCGVVQHQPPIVALGSGKGHYSNEGIKKAKAFSLNIPSADMVKATDYCGMVSGKDADKSKIFKVFYGKLDNAPMIEACPLCLECRLVAVLDLGGTNEIFLGEVVETYAEESCLRHGLPDPKKVNPLVFTMHDNQYWQLGTLVGPAWQMGKHYSPKPPKPSR